MHPSNPALRPIIGSSAIVLSVVLALPALWAPGRAEAQSRAKGKAAKRATSDSASAAEAGADLNETIGRILAKHGGGKWEAGAVVIDDTGKTRASVDGDRPLSPASNEKVLTVVSALGLVGPDFAYETTLASAQPPAGGVLKELIVRGTGDPNIPNRFVNEEPTSTFHTWAAELKKKGVTKVAGDLVVDDSCFDSVRFLPGWKTNHQDSWYEAEVCALSFNDNCIGVAVQPTSAGKPGKVVLSPETSYVTIENRSRTGGGKKDLAKLGRRDGTNTIIVSGDVGRALDTNHISVEDPALYFGTVLSEVLRADGIPVEGKVVRGKLAERGGASPSVLLVHRSTLATDLPVINKHSLNLHAEILLKAIGAKKGGEGSVAGGIRAVTSFLQTAGLPMPGLHIEDGSGLSSGNRVAPCTLAAVLSWASKQPFFMTYRNSLPIGGVDGTLKRRFKGKTSATHVYAKTGYLTGVSGLSGYVEKGGRHWVFSVIVNGLRSGASDAKVAEEEIAQAVYDAMPAK